MKQLAAVASYRLFLPVDGMQKNCSPEKKTVLVVDDNAEMREYLQHIFGHKYFVYTAENGIKGVELASQHLPDIIISDINMDGWMVLNYAAK